MIKVDLHLHSPTSKKIGDAIGWISLATTINKIRNQDIQLISFTDHDHFSAKFYQELTEQLIGTNIRAFPGCELTIARKTRGTGHILFIFDNKYTPQELKQLERIINEIRLHSSTGGAKIAKVIAKLRDYDFMICPHVDKVDAVTWADVAEVKDYIFNVECSRKSVKYAKFLREANGTNINPVKFSDCHLWNDDKFKWTGCYLQEYHQFADIKNKLKMMEG
ncbi:MAG: hypothetical protein LBD63_01190 [Mycoplasmataceae bacterium]|jgi:hypothetical protein|nr:hypothetical protein [Mycoplasmataceae bacterium]